MRLFLLALALPLAACERPAEPDVEQDRQVALAEAQVRLAEADARAREAEARTREADARVRIAEAGSQPSASAAGEDRWAEEAESVEGILGQRRGDWFVVVGGGRQRGEAQIGERQRQLERAGFRTVLVDSDDFPNFNQGLAVLVIGPQPEGEARRVLRDVRRVVPDAYVKSGW